MRARTTLSRVVVVVGCGLVLYGLRQAGCHSTVSFVSNAMLIAAAVTMIHGNSRRRHQSLT